jgi:hypothetical protein
MSSSVIVPADALFDKNPQIAADVFTLYSFVWRGTDPEQGQSAQRRRRRRPEEVEQVYSRAPFDAYRSPIVGYKPFVAALPRSDTMVMLDFWHHEEIGIPAQLINILQGEIDNGQ